MLLGTPVKFINEIVFGHCVIYKSDSARNGNMIINMVERLQ